MEQNGLETLLIYLILISFYCANSTKTVDKTIKHIPEKRQSRNYADNECRLKVQNISVEQFTKNVLKHRYNFAHLKLHFRNVSIVEGKSVLSARDWIWTYKGENGGFQYLYLPFHYGYSSLGILWSYTKVEPFPIDLVSLGKCSNLTIGDQRTDSLISDALGEMSISIASELYTYDKCYWCYMKRLYIHNKAAYELCKTFICTVQQIEYNCCEYKVKRTAKNSTVTCGKEHFYLGYVWWLFPILLGEFCFAVFPLLMTNIAVELSKASEFLNADERFENVNSSQEYKKYIRIKDDNPVSFLSTVCLPCRRLQLANRVLLRISRIFVIFIPVVLTSVHVILDYHFHKEFVSKAVKKGALLSFTSLIAGYSESRRTFMPWLGGPYVALSIYIVFGCVMVVVPSNLETSLEKGLNNRKEGCYNTLFTIPFGLKERLSRVPIDPHRGYKRYRNYLLAQSLMLLNWRFWAQSLVLFKKRWTKLYFSRRGYLMSCLVSFLLPFYIILCVIELFCASICFLIPALSCFIIMFKAVVSGFMNMFGTESFFCTVIKGILILPVLALFCITWYTCADLFFDGFWFLSDFVFLTYTGIIEFPKLSYGYLILGFMTIYYVHDAFNTFGKSYKHLLKMSVSIYEKMVDKYCDRAETGYVSHSIPRVLFNIIIERNLPRRNQVLFTIMRLTLILVILIVSIRILIAFDRFKELSLVVHVMTALFICSLPQIVKQAFLKPRRENALKSLKKNVKKTVRGYIRYGATMCYEELCDSITVSEYLEVSGCGDELDECCQ